MMSARWRAAAGVLLLSSTPVQAGVFIFAESLDEDDVTHPIGYRGTGTDLTLDVCITPGLPNAVQTPLRNAIDRFNLMVPTVGNVNSGVELPNGGSIDFESVLVHEMGHCLGLGHVNLASESGLEGAEQDFTRTTRGRNLVYQLDDGRDNIIGSPDDRRGDDSNLHWFFIDVNNPFVLPEQPDEDNYSRDLRDLPGADEFVANGDFGVAQERFGLPSTEAVMQQGTFANEVQRSLTADDVATLLFARTGLDQQAGTRDDYTVTLEYGGVSTSSGCEIQIEFQLDTFAFCAVGAASINGDNTRLTSATAVFGSDTNWAFETERIPLPSIDEAMVITNGSTSTVNAGDTTLIDNDIDQEGAGLVVSEQVAFLPDHGTVILSADGSFTYTHNGNDATADRFVYEVCSGDSLSCSHQYVNVTIVPNSAPAATADQIEVIEGGSATRLVGRADSVLDNDSDPDGDPITVTRTVTDVQFGQLNLSADGTFIYTHDGSQNLSDSFVYEVCDDRDPPACATQVVTIQVDNVNDAPVLDPPAPSSVTMSEDGAPTPFALDLDAIDDDGDSIVWSTVQMTPAGGEASINDQGIVSYRPAADFFGADSIAIEFSDGTVNQSVSIEVTVESVNDAPSFVANNPPPVLSSAGPVTISDWIESVTVGPANESEQSIQFQIANVQDAEGALNGSIALDSNGELSYQTSGVAGLVTFDVTAIDNGGTANGGNQASAAQSFTLTITADEPPIVLQGGPFFVPNTAPLGSAVADIDANNGNGGGTDQGLSYQVLGGTGAAAFSVDSADGEVSVTASLATLTGQILTLEVEISDGGLSTTQSVELIIEEAPLFSDGFEALE